MAIMETIGNNWNNGNGNNGNNGNDWNNGNGNNDSNQNDGTMDNENVVPETETDPNAEGTEGTDDGNS